MNPPSTFELVPGEASQPVPFRASPMQGELSRSERNWGAVCQGQEIEYGKAWGRRYADMPLSLPELLRRLEAFGEEHFSGSKTV